MKDRTLPNDPVGSGNPRGKVRSRRKHRNDAGLTPTEQHRKDVLMRQFTSGDGPKGNSPEYLNSPAWCRGCDGRRLASTEGLCGACGSKECAQAINERFDAMVAK